MIETYKVLLLGVYDYMFKAIMLDPINEDYLKELIHMITKISLEYLKNIKVENAEYIINNKNDKRMHSDIIVSVGKKYLNIELNKDYYTGLFSKNTGYVHKLASTIYNKGEDYLSDSCIIQINFDNFSKFSNKKEIYEFVMTEKYTNEIMDENYINYHIDLEYIRKTCYNKPVNKLSKFERYCLMLMAETKKYADKISGDDKIMNKVRDRLETLSSDDKMLGLYDAELEAEKVRRTQIKGAKIEKSKEIAKNMLNKNMDKNIISEVTGLTIAEIEKL